VDEFIVDVFDHSRNPAGDRTVHDDLPAALDAAVVHAGAINDSLSAVDAEVNPAPAA
jgi:hypothetical protein